MIEGAGERHPNDDMPSPEDKGNGEDEMQPYPDVLQKTWAPVPKDKLPLPTKPRRSPRKGVKIAHNFTLGWEIGTAHSVTRKGSGYY